MCSGFVLNDRGCRFGPLSLLDIRLEIWVTAVYMTLALAWIRGLDGRWDQRRSPR